MKTWITESLPDADITVMMRLADDEYPVWPGYYDGEQWRTADGEDLGARGFGPVTGWMHIHDAAQMLDGKGGAE